MPDLSGEGAVMMMARMEMPWIMREKTRVRREFGS